jgi:hypothetical protein
MKQYTVTTTDNLRMLCIRNNWFEEGTNTQYDKMFRANESGASIEEIATIIWLCSDEEQWARRDILAKLEEARKNYEQWTSTKSLLEGE